MASKRSWRRRGWQFFGSVRTGIVLLILVGIAALAGTVILQRPINEPQKLHQAYSPEVLRWLDQLGLTDVFHSWWFIFLLALLSTNIVVASVDRFPEVWRYFSRPYRRAEPHFLASLRLHQEIPLEDDADGGIAAAEQAFRRMGLKPQRLAGQEGPTSLYAERNRFARLAPYVVHSSLLLILAGGIIDGVWGFKGFISLTANETGNTLELRDGTHKPLPFALRCEAAGQENYPDGTPKRWWSKLVVLEDGREVKRKEIAVNDPLDFGGIRFFQASYGDTGEVTSVKLLAHPKFNDTQESEIVLHPGQPVRLADGASVRLVEFIPDFQIVNNQISTRSSQPNNPALQLSVEQTGAPAKEVWLFPRYPDFSHNDSAYDFHLADLKMGYFTGLQASYEPGQWLVWAGVVLMGVALALTFYFVHIRFWAVPVDDGRGRLVLWVAASANKNRDEFEERFNRLVHQITDNLKPVRAESEPAALAARAL